MRLARVPGYLCILSSYNQLYSGVGTALFGWLKYARPYFNLGLLIDTIDARNFDIGRRFCQQLDIEFLAEMSAPKVGASDPGIARIAHYLNSERWPFVEIVSWANAATNIDVAAMVPNTTTLVFTPHSQPLWTIPDAARYFLVEPAFRASLERADAVMCDSPQEVHNLRRKVPDVKAVYAPIGVDEHKFTIGIGAKRREVLMVCDFRETRKQVELAFTAMQRAIAGTGGNLKFTIAGHSSDVVEVPSAVAAHTQRMGYVDEPTLIALYQRASVFLLLSDYEAFGIPIVEAMFCGSRVVINDTPELHSLFDGLPGVSLVKNREPDAVDAALLAALTDGTPPEQIRLAAVERFAGTTAYRQKLDAINANARGRCHSL